MYKFQDLLKNVKNIQLEFEETTVTFKNKLTTRSLEYVVRAVLTSNHIDKLNYNVMGPSEVQINIGSGKYEMYRDGELKKSQKCLVKSLVN